MDPLLNGHNPEERVVAVQQLNDQTVRLFKRIEGKILQKDVEFFPFFFLSDETLMKDFPKKFWLKELAGKNFYRYIAAFSRWSEMWEAIHFILKQYNKIRTPRISSYQELKELLVRPDAVRQFLLESGVTLYKGMKFDELVRLHIDIQYASMQGKKRRRKSQEERILVITLLTDDGKKIILSTHRRNERKVLEQCIRHINKIDPDIIDGYDLFGTILPALSRSCERQQVPLAIGRDGSSMRPPGGFGSTGTSESDWFSFEISGRHLVDILTVAEAEIGVKRSDQSYTLLSLAKHFGIPLPTELPLPAHRLVDEWNRDPKNVENFSLRNAQIVCSLSDTLLQPLFYLAQMCPLNYRMLAHLSPASRIESLMFREYVRQKHSLPKASEGSRAISVPAEIFQIGIFDDVLYVELEGLHSAIILQQNLKPKTDTLDIFLLLLKHLASLKKELAEQSLPNSSQESEEISRMNALKNLINSFHLYLGSPKGLFNDPDQADTAFTASREILREIIRHIVLFNAHIIQSDGNGFFLTLPDNIIGETNIKNFIERLTNTLPNGMSLILKNHYAKMLSYRRNNYAVLDKSNAMTLKGNTLISHGMERYLRIFIRRFIECLLTNDLNRLHHTYASAHTQIIQHQWTPADFCRTELVRMDTETYQNETAARQTNPSLVLEAAIRSSLFVKANTRIAYYYSGTGTEMIAASSTRLIEEWNPHSPDENTGFYLARLREAAQKFRDFFEPTAFERILSLDDIFGFSDEGIHILHRNAAPEAAEGKADTEEYGIWLAEEE
jgi:DNA polymerase, archaea type